MKTALFYVLLFLSPLIGIAQYDCGHLTSSNTLSPKSLGGINLYEHSCEPIHLDVTLVFIADDNSERNFVANNPDHQDFINRIINNSNERMNE